MARKTALIIGAGPAGLTAAFELLKRTDIQPIVLEKSGYMGGLSRTINFKGNRIDIGGHRFFSKSDRVMQWWMAAMPPERASGTITYHNQSRPLPAATPALDPETEDRVMLLRNRKSRIYFLQKFFDYPVKFDAATIRNLGLGRTFLAGLSYIRSTIRPVLPERSLEDFLINRFGRRLYEMFFKSYTEKVWGVPCRDISAEWGAQRIKGLSLRKALGHFLKSGLQRSADLGQKQTETSLIERFLYPKYGPGQLWEYVAQNVREGGGEIYSGWDVVGVCPSGQQIKAVEAICPETKQRRTFEADYFFSTMPVKDLIRALPEAPDAVRSTADGLVYRDFITVGVLLTRLRVSDGDGKKLIADNWIYIQDPEVLVGRIQIFNNWSPYLVRDPELVWIGLEYFCSETDALWNNSDEALIALAKEELERIGIAGAEDVLDATVIRMPKTYPAYFGSYDRFDQIRAFVDRFENLFLIGRNGMHKYNNQDHSMLTAMIAVDNIVAGISDKSNIWEVNTEMEYHESR